MAANVVTISASFGAGGSLVGPAVAERLGLPFVDRLIPAAVAASLDVPIGRVLAHDEKPSGLVARIIARMGAAALPYGASPVGGNDPAVDEDIFRAKTEQVIHEIAAGDGAVVLGRGAVLVLADHPSAFHVRLDGGRDARIARVAKRQDISVEKAAELLDDTDRAREAYLHHFYKADVHDGRLYHLKIDSVTVPIDTCVQLIVTAARSVFEGTA